METWFSLEEKACIQNYSKKSKQTDLFSLLGANFQGSAMSDEMAKYAAMHAQQMAMSAMSTMYPGMAGLGMMGKPGQQQNQGHILFVHGLPPDMNEEYLWQVIHLNTLIPV